MVPGCVVASPMPKPLAFRVLSKTRSKALLLLDWMQLCHGSRSHRGRNVLKSGALPLSFAAQSLSRLNYTTSNKQRFEMGWPSTFEHIQERRNEAEYFRREALVYMREPTPQPASVAMREARPQPASVGEVTVNWTYRRGQFMVMSWGPPRGAAAIGTSNMGGAHGAVQLSFEVASKSGDGDIQADLRVRIGAEDFRTLIRTMMLANKQVALDAMRAELRRSAGFASSSAC
jgi:hypothetical protein